MSALIQAATLYSVGAAVVRSMQSRWTRHVAHPPNGDMDLNGARNATRFYRNIRGVWIHSEITKVRRLWPRTSIIRSQSPEVELMMRATSRGFVTTAMTRKPRHSTAVLEI